MKKIIVSQIGSRHRYMIPQIFESKGMLACLYTDSYNNSLIGLIFKLLSKLKISNKESKRLLNRKPGFSDKLIYANDFLQIKLLYHRIIKSPSIELKKIRFEGSSRWFKIQGTKKADILYNMFIENFEYVLYAKSKGLKVICDIYENPYIFKELAEEILTIPEYSCIRHHAQGFRESYELRMKYFDRMLELADAYLIPSAYVAEVIRQSPNFNPKKVHVIPYASSISNSIVSNKPQKGRLIWIGSDPVRKGIVYCQRAAKILKEKYPFIDFRIIGTVSNDIVSSNDFKDLNFIGHLNKEQLEQEFKSADIFVFPTLAEGFAGALLEAASYGVPIITTHASGFDNDFPGVFIQQKSTEDIVNAVEHLMNNREERDCISQRLYEYSQNIDKEAFSNSIIQLVNTL